MVYYYIDHHVVAHGFIPYRVHVSEECTVYCQMSAKTFRGRKLCLKKDGTVALPGYCQKRIEVGPDRVEFRDGLTAIL